MAKVTEAVLARFNWGEKMVSELICRRFRVAIIAGLYELTHRCAKWMLLLAKQYFFAAWVMSVKTATKAVTMVYWKMRNHRF